MKINDFNLPPARLEEVFKLIVRVPTGRKIYESFAPLFKAKTVEVKPYPENVLVKLKEALGEGQPVGACFMNDGESGAIYIDPTSPIGVLAPFLLHEMVHALDESLWAMARGQKSKRKKGGTAPVDEAMLGSESKAYEAQSQFTQELRERFPEYARFLMTQFPRARILHEKLSKMDIAKLYGFKVS